MKTPSPLFSASTVMDSILFRASMQRDLSALAQIVADNSTAALSFEDPRVAAETLAAEVGQIAAVIDVGMAQQDRVNLLGVKGKLAVALDGFRALALEQAALQQQLLTVELEQKHRAGGRAGGAQEVDSHPPEHGNGGRKVECGILVPPLTERKPRMNTNEPNAAYAATTLSSFS